MGICGTAMGNIAVLMKRQGHEVLGSDSGVYPPMSDLLAAEGIAIEAGFAPEHIEAAQPDLVVVGNAMSRGNAQVEWLLETRAFPFTSLPELVSREILARRKNIVVAGTHGKTTTTALTAWLLAEAGAKPGWMVGGVPRDLPCGAELGHDGGPFVIEGDEYDSAFFDKRSKFIHYQPRTLVLNNLEFDHGDIFRDLEDILRSFRHVTRLVPGGGHILYNADDSNLLSLLPVDWTRCISVGTGDNAEARIENFSEDTHGSTYTLVWPDGTRTPITSALHGLYNARNTVMAALAAGLTLCPENPASALDLKGLATYQGVRRRQDIRLNRDDLVVIEDFGHHPTAIKGTLESLRARYPGWRLTACFEPRSNTACTNRFQREFTEALALADACYLAPVHRGERYGEAQLDTQGMASELTARGTCTAAFSSFDALVDELAEATLTKHDQPRCVVVFSNGAFGGKLPVYLERVE